MIDIKQSLAHTTWNCKYHIVFPPCTHLAASGAKHFAAKRSDGRQQAAIKFFMQIVNADCERIAIENPVGIISGKYIRKWFPDLDKKYGFPIKPSQIIHPWQFGHPYEKTTCIWLKGIRPLRATKILKKPGRGWVNQSFTKDGRYGGFNGEFGDAKTRSKTFHGIAKAMAEQWAGIAHERG